MKMKKKKKMEEEAHQTPQIAPKNKSPKISPLKKTLRHNLSHSHALQVGFGKSVRRRRPCIFRWSTARIVLFDTSSKTICIRTGTKAGTCFGKSWMALLTSMQTALYIAT